MRVGTPKPLLYSSRTSDPGHFNSLSWDKLLNADLNSDGLAGYIAEGGFEALKQCLGKTSPEKIIEQIEKGGAGEYQRRGP
mgnify:CR=1 FL=1